MEGSPPDTFATNKKASGEYVPLSLEVSEVLLVSPWTPPHSYSWGLALPVIPHYPSANDRTQPVCCSCCP